MHQRDSAGRQLPGLGQVHAAGERQFLKRFAEVHRRRGRKSSKGKVDRGRIDAFLLLRRQSYHHSGRDSRIRANRFRVQGIVRHHARALQRRHAMPQRGDGRWPLESHAISRDALDLDRLRRIALRPVRDVSVLRAARRHRDCRRPNHRRRLDARQRHLATRRRQLRHRVRAAVWTGSPSPNVAGTLATTSQDWTPPGGADTGSQAVSNVTDAWWNTNSTTSCGVPHTIFCLEQ
jgi:hypothetical protein